MTFMNKAKSLLHPGSVTCLLINVKALSIMLYCFIFEAIADFGSSSFLFSITAYHIFTCRFIHDWQSYSNV